MANQTLDNFLFFSNGYGQICANDANHQIAIRADRSGTASDYTNYYQYGGTLAAGLGHKFWTGGTINSQTLKVQFADDGNYFACKVGIGLSNPGAILHVRNAAITAGTGSISWPAYNIEDSTTSKVVCIDTAGNGNCTTAGTGATVSLILGQYYDSRVVITPAGAGSGVPADQGTGYGRDLMVKGGYSDNTNGRYGGRLWLNGGMGYSGAFNTNVGNIIMQGIGGGGNVGIGVTSPVGKLDIATGGNTNIVISNDATDTGYNIVSLNGTRTKGSYAGIAGGGTSDNRLYLNSGQEVVIQTGASYTARMTITCAGNVGIGTSSPTEVAASWTTLDVTGKSSGGGGILYLSNFGKTVTSQFYSDGSGGRLGTLCNHFLALETCNTERMRISAAGNVGIGTTSPSTVLDIRGCNTDNAVTIRNFCGDSYSAIGYVNCQGTLKAAVGIGNNSAAAPFANNAYVYTPASTDFLFYIAGAERMRVRCDGNVGIGCTTPGSKLTVAGNAYIGTGAGEYFVLAPSSDLIICDSNSTGTFNQFMDSNVAYVRADTSAGSGCGTIRFNDNVLIVGCIGGRVGIGTTSPSYKLHVNGTFYAAGSSIKYKEGICNYDTNSCLFMCLKPVAYQYKDEFKHLGKELKADTQIGLIAEDVAEVMPELAVLVNEEDEKVVRNVDYEKLSIVLLAEVQKLRKEMDELKNK